MSIMNDMNHVRCNRTHIGKFNSYLSPGDMYLDGSITPFASAYTSNMCLIKAYRAKRRIDVDHERYEPCSL